MTDTQDKLIDADEAADMLSISTRSLARLVKDGRVPSIRLGNLRRFDPTTLRQWIRSEMEKSANGKRD